MSSQYTGLIDHYSNRLPVSEKTPRISLSEGNTPLIELTNIPADIGSSVKLYVKFEGLNPTGSFKDRGMTMAISKAAEAGAKAVVCASTGNTSAAAAAYAAKAGMTAFVLIPEGKIAMGKLAQAMMYGAVIIQIKGNFDDGMELVKKIAEETPVAIVNSVNPYRLQGQKTAAFEIIEELGRAPDYHCIPVGNAGNISGYWMGYCEASGNNTASCTLCNGKCPYLEQPMADSRPRMLGYQASGAAPFLRNGKVENPETVATAIRIGNPQSFELAKAAVDESGGWFDEFTDTEILAMQKRLANREGIFCEPASAISVCGAVRDIEAGKIADGSIVTCTVTGHGLKDSDIAIEQCKGSVLTVDAELDAVKTAIVSRIS